MGHGTGSGASDGLVAQKASEAPLSLEDVLSGHGWGLPKTCPWFMDGMIRLIVGPISLY